MRRRIRRMRRRGRRKMVRKRRSRRRSKRRRRKRRSMRKRKMYCGVSQVQSCGPPPQGHPIVAALPPLVTLVKQGRIHGISPS